MHHTLRTQDLEQAIDQVVRSYDGPEEINNLESAALPNKRAIVEAYQHIKPVIYLGFYSLRSLKRENLRFAISEHLYPAYEIFVEQIERALTYETSVGRSAGFPAGWSEEVVLRLWRVLRSQAEIEYPAVATSLWSNARTAHASAASSQAPSRTGRP